MRYLLGEVAVWGCADVESGFGVLLETSAGLLQHFQDVPLRDALFDAAGQDVGGARGGASAQVDGFVGGEQRDAEALEFVFDAGGEDGAPPDPVDGFADDDVEAPVR
ncbi:hypothetical protein [Nocardia cyriacigeorgica]|uniref:hypothetical protein n=1 Tax=Nocardia cyriacigeorgica TaxID=135487 RepID=UPI001E46D46E|nr:hypothetical protein [Nocardia cyriacigeorgica]